MDVFINELQRIPVAGDNDALPALLRADFRRRADHIVRFPALTFVNWNVHSPEHILHDGHLLGQLLRHSVTIGLVALIFQMAEGWPVEVEGHGNGLRLLFLFHPLQNIQKTVDGVGVQAIPGGQGTHAEKGPVDDTVAV